MQCNAALFLSFLTRNARIHYALPEVVRILMRDEDSRYHPIHRLSAYSLATLELEAYNAYCRLVGKPDPHRQEPPPSYGRMPDLYEEDNHHIEQSIGASSMDIEISVSEVPSINPHSRLFQCTLLKDLHPRSPYISMDGVQEAPQPRFPGATEMPLLCIDRDAPVSSFADFASAIYRLLAWHDKLLISKSAKWEGCLVESCEIGGVGRNRKWIVGTDPYGPAADLIDPEQVSNAMAPPDPSHPVLRILARREEDNHADPPLLNNMHGLSAILHKSNFKWIDGKEIAERWVSLPFVWMPPSKETAINIALAYVHEKSPPYLMS